MQTISKGFRKINHNASTLHCYAKLSLSPLQARRFATRKPPSFGSTIPSSKDPKFHKPGPESLSAKKPLKQDQPDFGEKIGKKSSEKKPRRKLPIGRLIILSVFAYIGYRVYTWQTNPYRSRILNNKNFTPFILENRNRVSSTSIILYLLSLPKGQNVDNVTEAWRTGIWSVQVMQPELQIARSYTPLPPADNAEPEQLRLFVRKEPQGEVSSFLHRISRGTLVHLRGPHLEYELPPDVDEILFLAGGTGIAPALQVAHTLYNYRASPSKDGPKLSILWANRRREDSLMVLDTKSPHSQPQNPLVEEVESLKSKYSDKVHVEYLVDDESSHITEAILRKYTDGVEQSSSRTGKRLLLISGPEGFVNLYAGPKFMKNGRELQGPLGGLLQKISPRDWEVWKL